MSLMAINLNLIPVLRELLAHRSVSAAARVLGRSPSAVSESLTQLRLTFDDPLLIRTAGGMALTPRAIELIASVEATCAQIEAMLRPSEFEPAKASRMFVIAAPDNYVFSLGPLLLDNLREAAPGIHLRFIELDEDLPARMATRAVDFSIMPQFHIRDLASAKLQHLPMTEDWAVALMRDGHPLSQEKAISETQLAGYSHVTYLPSWVSTDQRSPLTSYRQSFPVAARTSQITLVPFFLPGTDYVALVPERVAAKLASPLGLVIRPLSFKEPIIHGILAWNPIQDADPAHRWFRDFARRVVYQAEA